MRLLPENLKDILKYSLLGNMLDTQGFSQKNKKDSVEIWIKQPFLYSLQTWLISNFLFSFHLNCFLIILKLGVLAGWLAYLSSVNRQRGSRALYWGENTNEWNIWEEFGGGGSPAWLLMPGEIWNQRQLEWYLVKEVWLWTVVALRAPRCLPVPARPPPVPPPTLPMSRDPRQPTQGHRSLPQPC